MITSPRDLNAATCYREKTTTLAACGILVGEMGTGLCGNELKRLMKQALTSQRALAKALCLTPQAISKWCLGLSSPTEEHDTAARKFLVARIHRFRKAKEAAKAVLQE